MILLKLSNYDFKINFQVLLILVKYDVMLSVLNNTSLTTILIHGKYTQLISLATDCMFGIIP